MILTLVVYHCKYGARLNSSDLRMKIFHLATSLRACNIFHIIHYLENNDITPLLSPESLEISPSHCGVYPSHHLSPLASEGKELAAQASREGFDFSLQDSGHWVESRPPPPQRFALHCPPAFCALMLCRCLPIETTNRKPKIAGCTPTAVWSIFRGKQSCVTPEIMSPSAPI